MGRSSDLRRDGVRGAADGPADDTGCTVLHADMDAFYASVEVRRRPELRGKAVIVAGGGPRGVVLSATYPAREFGVRAAMPAAAAIRRCPQAVVLEPDFTEYAAASGAVMAIFREFTPAVEPLSLDEAFLDVSGALRRMRCGPAELGERIRRRVAADTDLTCSVGVAATLFAAKLASGLAKPDGLLVIPADRVLDVLHPLPVSALWGVGERTAERLAALGLRTVGELAAAPRASLRRAVGQAVADQLHALASGHDDRRVDPDVAEKSVGAERTFGVDLADGAELRRELLRLAERTAATLRRRGLVAGCVTIKVRYADFSTVNRSRTLAVPTDIAAEVYRIAVELLDRLGPARPLRLVGVRAEQLAAAESSALQMVLDEPEHGRRDAELAADAARSRFGPAAVGPGTLLQPKRPGSA